MTFADAAAFVMPFGKHRGKTIDSIGTTDAGLLYLDWLRGEYMRGGAVGDALAAYIGEIESFLRTLAIAGMAAVEALYRTSAPSWMDHA